MSQLNGISIDDLDIECSVYHTEPAFLQTENEIAEEILHSDLLKSNCLVTNQPDWCSVQIAYKGKKINREGLLRYIVSFRNDNEFHEQCIEKIFMHIRERCQPSELTVYGRSTRRGGVDINSIRSTKPINLHSLMNIRLCRQ
jgi:7-cyano-7-deazaguanine reductase